MVLDDFNRYLVPAGLCSSLCLRRLSDTRVPALNDRYALVRHHRLKDMHRLGQDARKTFDLTAPISFTGRSLGPQVVAISPKKSKVVPTMSAKHSREYLNDSKDSYDQVGSIECSTLYRIFCIWLWKVKLINLSSLKATSGRLSIFIRQLIGFD